MAQFLLGGVVLGRRRGELYKRPLTAFFAAAAVITTSMWCSSACVFVVRKTFARGENHDLGGRHFLRLAILIFFWRNVCLPGEVLYLHVQSHTRRPGAPHHRTWITEIYEAIFLGSSRGRWVSVPHPRPLRPRGASRGPLPTVPGVAATSLAGCAGCVDGGGIRDCTGRGRPRRGGLRGGGGLGDRGGDDQDALGSGLKRGGKGHAKFTHVCSLMCLTRMFLYPVPVYGVPVRSRPDLRRRHPLLLLPPVAEPHPDHLLLQLEAVGQVGDLLGGGLRVLVEVLLEGSLDGDLDGGALLTLTALGGNLCERSCQVFCQ